MVDIETVMLVPGCYFGVNLFAALNNSRQQQQIKKKRKEEDVAKEEAAVKRKARAKTTVKAGQGKPTCTAMSVKSNSLRMSPKIPIVVTLFKSTGPTAIPLKVYYYHFGKESALKQRERKIYSKLGNNTALSLIRPLFFFQQLDVVFKFFLRFGDLVLYHLACCLCWCSLRILHVPEDSLSFLHLHWTERYQTREEKKKGNIQKLELLNAYRDAYIKASHSWFHRQPPPATLPVPLAMPPLLCVFMFEFIWTNPLTHPLVDPFPISHNGHLLK